MHCLSKAETIVSLRERRVGWDAETPGSRIRAKREQLGVSQEKLVRRVGLNVRAINRIELGLLSVSLIADYLPLIAAELGATVEVLLEGELQSQRSTRGELQRLRRDGLIRSDADLKLVEELAMEAHKKRRNANIPLSREELILLIEVIRGADGL